MARSFQQGVLSQEPSARSPQPGVVRQECSARNPLSGVASQKSSARSPPPGVLSQQCSARSQARVLRQESLARSHWLEVPSCSVGQKMCSFSTLIIYCRHLPSGTCSSPQSAASDWLVSQPPRPMDCNCDQHLLYWRTLQHLLRRSLQMATLRKLKGSAPVLEA